MLNKKYFLLILFLLLPLSGYSSPLKIVATIPDLASLAQTIGGDEVECIIFAKGFEDPHFVLPRPSFAHDLNSANILMVSGLDLEEGWLPPLLEQARNPKILPGQKGYFDASFFIVPLDRLQGTIDRSMGDVHPFGNPHYLLDPMNGLKVAKGLRDLLIYFKPTQKAFFEKNFNTFKSDLGAGLFGRDLAEKYDVEKLAILQENQKLEAFLKTQRDWEKMGGWTKTLYPLKDHAFYDDHNMWTYFVRRFSLKVADHLEPKAGIPPTLGHLNDLVKRIKPHAIKGLISSPYYPNRYADFMAEKGGLVKISLSHQVNGRKGTENYLKLMQYNVNEMAQVTTLARDK